MAHISHSHVTRMSSESYTSPPWYHTNRGCVCVCARICVCVTRDTSTRSHIQKTTHLYVWHNWPIYATWRMHVSHDRIAGGWYLQLRAHQLIHTCDQTHICVCRDYLICRPWLIHGWVSFTSCFVTRVDEFMRHTHIHTHTHTHTQMRYNIRINFKRFVEEGYINHCTHIRRHVTLINESCHGKTQKTENSNLYGFEVHRPSSKGTKLLFQVIQAIIYQTQMNVPPWLWWRELGRLSCASA